VAASFNVVYRISVTVAATGDGHWFGYRYRQQRNGDLHPEHRHPAT